ncbi:MAG: hypothetical protein LBD81_01010 [Holosporaceae bacterium]|nr:hypothetical protein [Holosporaceae bacterium]
MNLKIKNLRRYAFIYRAVGVSILLITPDFLFYIVECRLSIVQNWKSLLFTVPKATGLTLLNKKA